MRCEVRGEVDKLSMEICDWISEEKSYKLNGKCIDMKMKILMGVIFPILMALIMGVLMAFVMVAINVGFSNVGVFFKAWGGSTLIGFAVALPISLVIVPLLQKSLMKLAEDAPPQDK